MKDKQSNLDSKKPLGRKEQEAGEGLQEIKFDAPSSRFQTEQQVQPAAEALDAKGENTTWQKKKTEAKGSQLKQEVAAKVIHDSIAGEIPVAISGRKTLSFSGNDGTVLGSTAGTPIVGQRDRADSRFGKKIDATNKRINYVGSEQTLVEMDESKPLSQNRDAVQGYNGTYRGQDARSQKNTGGVPADLYFQRSIDIIARDEVYFTHGQVVKQQDVVYEDVPTKTLTANNDGVYVESDYAITRGNFIPRALNVTITNEGKITGFNFDTLDISSSSDDQGIIAQASASEKIFLNEAEIFRQNMDAKAGDEKADIWTPLARAVQQPSQDVAYLYDMERDTGSEVYMAYKKTAACASYQINKTAKDGLHAVRPMKEALTGALLSEVDSSVFANGGAAGDSPFQQKYYVKGSAALMIALNDSVAKYVTKADLMTQPKGFVLQLQTADNNMNILRLDPRFVAAVNGREVFSTIDRDYDPTAPVCMSDRAILVHPYDWNELYSFSELNSDGSPKFKNNPLKYSYSDLRNNYVVTVTHPLLAGIHKYLAERGSKLWNLCKPNSGNSVTIQIPIFHGTKNFSLWSLLCLAATPYITQIRVNSMRDVLYYEKNVEYPFYTLKAISDLNPMDAVNYENKDYREPLVSRQMTPAVALTWTLPELFWPFDEESSDNTYKYVLPWYFNEENFNFDASGNVSFDSNEACMSMPSIRSGVRLAYLDDIYGMEERDVRLCLDKMIVPIVSTSAGGGVYKYGQTTDGIPFMTIAGSQFTLKNYLATPREIGYSMVAPYGLARTVYAGDMNAYLAGDASIYGQSSYILTYWTGAGIKFADSVSRTILLPTAMNVDRSTNFEQNWYTIPAILLGDDWSMADPGFVPGVGYLFDSSLAPVANKSKFTPFTNGVDAASGQTVLTDNAYQVVSLQKGIWTRIQKLPFVISPFDVVSSTHKVGEDGLKFDIFDFAYYFGLAGFRASDYLEDIYNRTNMIDEQGLGFIKDPFYEDSPLIRAARGSSQA